MAKVTTDLAEWMTQLSIQLKDIPIINLGIPGSHDSMSYGIRRRAKVAPDAVPVVNKVYIVLPCVVRRWAITQKLNVMQQLMQGIRYLDLRICMNPTDNNFYFVHGLFCEEISNPLAQIRQFMDDHPNEFIIFDCQHFYSFSNGDYGRLERIFFKYFSGKFYTIHDGSLAQLTLNKANSLQKQLLVVYRYSHVPKEFWDGDSWPTPWPNQINVKKLETYLENSIKYRDPLKGYVTQCVLTPPVKFIVRRFYSSLRNKCARKVNKNLIDWIRNQQVGPFTMDTNQPTSNVFIADFIEINNSAFCRAVIELNSKILGSSQGNDHITSDNMNTCDSEVKT